jgi:hypothetical protein
MNAAGELFGRERLMRALREAGGETFGAEDRRPARRRHIGTRRCQVAGYRGSITGFFHRLKAQADRLISRVVFREC